MIIPLRTDRPIRRRPVVTLVIVAATVLMHIVLEILRRQSPDQAAQIFTTLWLAPGDSFRWWGLATCALLHGGWLHLFMNMVFLYAFGPTLEDRLGRIGFALAYIGGAVAASAGHMLLDGSPAIGASGAVAAVTGMFLVLFPRSLVRCFSLLFFLGPPVFDIPAWWLIAFQIAWNFLGVAVFGSASIAWFAHLAGYAFGIALAFGLLKLRVVPTESTDLLYAMRQAKRRRELREASDIYHQRQQRVLRSESKPEPPDPAVAKRAEVARLAASGSVDRMLAAYRELVDTHTRERSVLASQHQRMVANSAMASGDHRLARIAYEGYLEHYPDERDAGEVRLMLAILLGRYHGEPTRGRELIEQALAQGLDESHHETARALLDELEQTT